jgi:hypothetical protein
MTHKSWKKMNKDRPVQVSDTTGDATGTTAGPITILTVCTRRSEKMQPV